MTTPTSTVPYRNGPGVLDKGSIASLVAATDMEMQTP